MLFRSEQAEQAARQQHADREPGVASVGLAFHEAIVALGIHLPGGRLAAVRPAVLVLLILICTAGCGGGEEAAPLPETVVGTVEQPSAEGGDPEAGNQVYDDSGCAGCHTFEPAGSMADVGPSLDDLPALAERADQGTLEEFTRTSLTNPNAYVEEGYAEGVMPPFDGSEQELTDLVAFLTQKQEQ